MSEFKGTPGPWFVSDRPHSYGREVSAGSPGGQVIAGGNGAPWPSLAEQQANARLMAAAPDLLAACRLALSFGENAVRAGLEGFSPQVEDEIVSEHVDLRVIRSAIAKATGN